MSVGLRSQVVVGEGSPEKQSLSRALQKGEGGSHAETWKSLPEGTEGLRGRVPAGSKNMRLV